MEAIGQLAGGVAHDFNNLLTAILGFTDLLKDRCRDVPDVCVDLDEVQSAGTSAASLTGQLLAFSRKQVLKPEVIVAGTRDRGTCVTCSPEFLARTSRSSRARRRPCRPRIEADPVQLQQVMLNLAANARDAMPRGGQLVDRDGRHRRLPRRRFARRAARRPAGTS